MYQRLPNWVLGFHGTDQKTVTDILNDPKGHLNSSANVHDWLGGGIYFWENDPIRALQFSKERMKWKGVTDKKPAVIGAIIDLGLCLNLSEQKALEELRVAYGVLKDDFELFGEDLPVNAPDGKLWSRNLDCLVIDRLHKLRENFGMTKYDSVRSSFKEGKEVYAGTEFQMKNHIQIAVRSTACIKGYFLPRDL
ncbi:hypothetical protein N5D77_24010 [Comamonas thiooxydans]|uniref:DUF3990 domain-containing protein n=1 Tax=Comamonas thiooxydans TaxID=363952 RepID=A0AA42TV45_9BURK|nr:hypothetical protein [Comamonas thiooxydans]MDH1337351.1 hypothetical protein [Comamonas thiooxydans]MDH1743443.1 hypothetical protein [Comamonas thiooxydans]MDH1789632.1 hypothetical protein [Comamonas thiooxydans]